MHRRLVVIPVAVALAAAASGAAATPAQAPETLKPGVLQVGIDVPAGAFATGSVTGGKIRNPRGFEIDLARAVAKRLGLRAEFVHAPWAKLFLRGGKAFDLAFEQATITPQRERTIDFTTPYFDANQGVLTSKGTTIRSLADLKAAATCGQSNTTGLFYLEQRIRPTQKPKVYPTTAAALQAVQVGQCDAIVLDVPIVVSTKKQAPAKYGVVAGQIVTKERYGGILQSGNAELRAPVNKAIKALIKNGTVRKLQIRWFGGDLGKLKVLR